jgi:hypothetical protein
MEKMIARQQTEEDEEIRATMERLGVSLDEARFVVAINRGEIDGDEVLVQSDRQPE